MHISYFNKLLAYTGKELRSLFIYHQFNLQGNALVAFSGPCKVTLADLVDQEDVKRNAPIFSKLMLHFLGEFFGDDLEKTILRQRLLMACIFESLMAKAPQFSWVRDGDDIFMEKKKVSVSIATASPVSTLIHAGLNIETKGTPLPTFGLKEAKIEPAPLAALVLERFKSEMSGVWLARCKVRGVD